MAICLTSALGLVLATLSGDAITLAWRHSVELVKWEEDYRVEGDHLRLVEARIQGAGAGMEVPEGARLYRGVWHYQPDLAQLLAVTLTRSSHTFDYRICSGDGCVELATLAGPMTYEGETVTLSACP